MKPTPRDVRWLVDQLDDQKRRLQNLENRKPGLAYSSIEDGAIREYDKNGTLGSQTGKQPDGTHGNVVYNGPPPPTPTLAKVAAVPGVVEVRWNGKFADDAVSPLDFKHVAAYVVAVGAPVDFAAQAGVMTGELGDALQVQVDAGVYDVYLASWSKAGRHSELAGPIAIAVPVAADVEAIQAALDDLDVRYDGVITEAGNLGKRLDTAETDIVAAEGRLDAAGTRLDTAFGQISTVDGKATAASTAASLAQSKADTAKSAADQAAADALAASGLALGKGKVLVQSAAPGVADRNAVTLWIDTTGGANTPKRWTTGTAWVAVTDKAATDAAAAAATAKSTADAAAAAALAAQQAAGAAQQTADNALTMAGTKARVYYSTSTPSGTASTNDIWRQVNAAKDVIGEWYWSGGWVKTLVSSQAISNLDVGKLTVGTGIISDLVAEHIAGRSARFIQLDVSQLVAVTGTMSEAVITKLFTDVVMSRKITTQMLAVGDFNNMAATGLESGSSKATGWASGLTLDATDKPSEAAFALKSTAGQGTYQPPSPYDYFDVTPGDELLWSVWLKASKPNSRFYQEVRDQLGGHGVTWSAIPGKPAMNPGSAYPMGGSVNVPTDWTQYWAAGVVKAGVTQLAIRSIYFNHSTGTETGAVVSIAGMSLRRKLAGELVVDGSITAESLASDAVTARHISGGAIDGMVITGAIIQSPGTGAGYQLTEGGYTSRDANGNVTIRLPTNGDPNQFKGDIEAQSLTVSGRASFQSANNEIASGATLVLEAGTTPPLTPPTVGADYAITPFAPLPAGESARGLAYAQGMWWRGVRRTASSLGRIEGLNSGGAVTVSYEIVEDPINGLTAIGNTLYLLGTRNARPANERWVVAYNVTTTAVTWSHFWQYTSYGSGTYQPGIGTDGTNVFITQSDANGKVIWRSFNKTTGAELTLVESAHNIKSDMAGIYKGVADWGADRVVLSKTNGTTEVYTAAGVHQSAVGWFNAGQRQTVGLAWANGKFWHMQTDVLISYSGIIAPSGAGVGDTDDWWIATTWRGAGGVETTIGPPQRFTFMRRSELQLSAGTLPAGATGARFYLARKVATPVRADFHLLATVTGTTTRITTLPTNWATTALPPATNTFSAASPAILRSRANNFQVDGAGAGKWGPLTFHPDGTMTSSAVPAWIPITSFLSSCTVGDFGFVPAYRSWPDGKVEMRGVIKGTLDTVKAIFSLPFSVRSAQPVNFVAATSAGGSSPAVMRIEIGSVENPDVMTIQPQGTTRSWISIDGLYYYQV